MWSRPLALVLLLLPSPALAGVKEKVAALAPPALVLVIDAKGNELVAQNTDEPFVPASVTKIVTAWLAMEVLGGGYRFETRFYLDDKRALYVRGGGDPFLISEELAPLATELIAAVGKKPIPGIVLDASYYPSNLRIPGIVDTGEAYNALNSALAVNFNTVYAVRSGNKVRSAEKQTPITPLAITQFRLRGPKGSGRISLSQDPAVSLQYAGELIAAFIERAGGHVKGKILTGTVPEGLEPIYVHRQSRTLSEILVELFRASNNYIANQVFLEIGAHRLGGPVSLEKSLQVANEMLAAHDLAALWKNLVNGRNALYLASHAYAIEGMEQAAAQKLLIELMDAATAPGLSYVHVWRKGDVVMWDNRATMHRGRPWPAHEARLMVRTTISATDADGLETVRSLSQQAAE
jgi:serine-type D-Ala-D-Ala carboxypeptidase/endopeptidase (penicillin-binding protein 4)